MGESWDEELTATFLRVLEDVAMIFGETAAPEDLDTPAAWVEVLLAFDGGARGRLRLLAAESVAAEVAASVLGLDPGDPEAHAEALDAFGELSNVTVGQLLTAIAGTGRVFHLDPPRARLGHGEVEWESLRRAPGTLAVLAEDQPVLLNLEYQPND